MRDNTRGYRRKTVNMHVELVSDDDVDEFKATVVLEQMIRAADVAALIQDWDNSMKWSTRLSD